MEHPSYSYGCEKKALHVCTLVRSTDTLCRRFEEEVGNILVVEPEVSVGRQV